MANPEHLSIAREGAEAVEKWNADNPGTALDLESAELNGIDLSGADLRGASFRFAKMEGSWFAGADLKGADFLRAHMPGSTLDGARACEARFAWANMQGSEFAGADLRGTNLNGADFTDSKLWSASLAGARLIGSNFTHTDLTWADLRDAKLVYAKMSRSTVRGTDLRGAQMKGAGIHILYGMHIQKPLCNDTTRWPDDFVTWEFQWIEGNDFSEDALLVRLRPGKADRETLMNVFRALDRLHRSRGGGGLKMVPVHDGEPYAMGKACEVALAAKEPPRDSEAFNRLVAASRRVNREHAVAWGPKTWGKDDSPAEQPVTPGQRLAVIAALRTHEEELRRLEKTVFSLKLKLGQIDLPREEAENLRESKMQLVGDNVIANENSLKESVGRLKKFGGHVEFRRISPPLPMTYQGPADES